MLSSSIRRFNTIVHHSAWTRTGIASIGLRQFLLAGFIVNLVITVLIWTLDIPRYVRDGYVAGAILCAGMVLLIVRPPSAKDGGRLQPIVVFLGVLGFALVAMSPTPDPDQPLVLIGIALVIAGLIVMRKTLKQ
jgi:hypothetical protein